MIKKDAWCFFKHLSILPSQQGAGWPSPSISEQHTLTQPGKPEFMKNKILLQGRWWFLATLSVHKVKFRGLSEQGVSYPCDTDAQELRISCSRAGDLISVSIPIYNPQYCCCLPGCFEALILWCPLWTASSGHPSSAQSPCGWGRQFSTKLPGTDLALKRCRHAGLLFNHSGEHSCKIIYAWGPWQVKGKSARRGVVMSPAVSSPSGRRGEGFKDTPGREPSLCHGTAEATNSHVSAFKKS